MIEPLGRSPHQGHSPSGYHHLLRRRQAPPHIRRRSRIVVQLLTFEAKPAGTLLKLHTEPNIFGNEKHEVLPSSEVVKLLRG